MLSDAKESLPPVGSDWGVKLPMSGHYERGGAFRVQKQGQKEERRRVAMTQRERIRFKSYRRETNHSPMWVERECDPMVCLWGASQKVTG